MYSIRLNAATTSIDYRNISLLNHIALAKEIITDNHLSSVIIRLESL